MYMLWLLVLRFYGIFLCGNACDFSTLCVPGISLALYFLFLCFVLMWFVFFYLIVLMSVCILRGRESEEGGRNTGCEFGWVGKLGGFGGGEALIRVCCHKKKSPFSIKKRKKTVFHNGATVKQKENSTCPTSSTCFLSVSHPRFPGRQCRAAPAV